MKLKFMLTALLFSILSFGLSTNSQARHWHHTANCKHSKSECDNCGGRWHGCRAKYAHAVATECSNCSHGHHHRVGLGWRAHYYHANHKHAGNCCAEGFNSKKSEKNND